MCRGRVNTSVNEWWLGEGGALILCRDASLSHDEE